MFRNAWDTRSTVEEGGRRGDHPDEELTTALYTEYYAVLLGFICRYVQDRYKAEDLVQETLLRAWRVPRVLRGPRAAHDVRGGGGTPMTGTDQRQEISEVNGKPVGRRTSSA
jgi:hypothetical protein